jgi:hypothetical protein
MMSRTSVDNLSQMLACLKERKELEELKEAAIAQLEAATLELALSHARLKDQETAAAIETGIVKPVPDGRWWTVRNNSCTRM